MNYKFKKELSETCPHCGVGDVSVMYSHGKCPFCGELLVVCNACARQEGGDCGGCIDGNRFVPWDKDEMSAVDADGEEKDKRYRLKVREVVEMMQSRDQDGVVYINIMDADDLYNFGYGDMAKAELEEVLRRMYCCSHDRVDDEYQELILKYSEEIKSERKKK